MGPFVWLAAARSAVENQVVYLNERSAERGTYTLKVLNRFFGSIILHEVTAHRVEQFTHRRRRDGSMA
jgi:hypothetical protein